MLKRITTTFILIFIFSLLVVTVSCSSKNPNSYYGENLGSTGAFSDHSGKVDAEIDSGFMLGEDYNQVAENNFVYTSNNPSSYFSMDSFTASYSNLRRYINNGQALNANIIRTDELINYFSYDLEKPGDGETFKVSAEMSNCPWNNNQLLTIAVTTKEEDLTSSVGNNLVFLIDISGSMNTANKIGLLKEGFNKLLDTLSPTDRISIVTYASGVKTQASGIYGDEKEQLKNIINNLKASGGTNGAGGIQQAYALANQYLIPGGNNRIILATDGDFNIGVSSQDELKQLISEKAESGIYLTALGFGMGNYHDSTLETLAKNGNGNYAYIDSSLEIEKVLVDELSKTLVTVAKDVKNKVEFNKEVVDSYRLIGYENKQLTADDFENEEKDAGEVGSGHTTFIAYEIVLKNESDAYMQNFFDVQINYKDPKSNESKTYKASFGQEVLKAKPSENHLFVSCLVEFALILRNSEYRGSANYYNLVTRLDELECTKTDKFKAEFVSLVKTAQSKNLIAHPIYDDTLIPVTLRSDYGYRIIQLKKNTVITEQLLLSIFYQDNAANYKMEIAYDADFTQIVTEHVLVNNLVLYIRVTKLTN